MVSLKKFFPVLASIVLINLSFASSGLDAKVMSASNLDKFVSALNNDVETYLKKELKRDTVGFKVTALGVCADISECKIIKFTIPDYIERETVFSLTIYLDNKKMNISGRVLDTKEREIVELAARKNFPEYKVENTISTFPFNIKKPYGVVVKPFANLYVKPGDKDLATQLLMGTPVRILEYSKDEKFARIQSDDDKYIAWIPRNTISELDEVSWNKWKSSRNIVIINDIKKPENIHFGTILPEIQKSKDDSKIKLLLPDGKNIIISSSDVEDLIKIKSDITRLINNANRFLVEGEKGKTKYVWGGTVGKELDCSGFNQTIFRSEGLFLPRDADQQQHFTKPVAADISKIDELKPGDLLFFSEKREYATHTGIYIGNYKFIHSSSGGKYRGIKISTLKGGDEYDKKLQKMYFGGGHLEFNN